MLFGLVMALLLVVTACSGGDEQATTDPDGETEEPTGEGDGEATGEPQQGGSIVMGTPGEPVTFNELYYQDSASHDVIQMLHVSLMQTDENLEIQPYAAVDHPEVSEDGLEWTYTIHEGMTFHDGEPVTAEDVAFTYNILIDPDYTGPRAGDFETLESVEVIDEHTVLFTLNEVDASFEARHSYNILPQHILGDIPVADLEEYREYNLDAPIGAGPFKFVEYVDGQYLTVEAFDDFFLGRPNLDSITFRYAADQNAVLLLFETGEIDHMVLPATEYATAETYDHGRISSELELRYDYIGWNNDRPLFQDPRVRQALTMAIDRQLIVDEIMGGRAEVAHTPASPLSWAYTDEVTKFDYDPAAAQELLMEAGWEPGSDGILEKDGERFSFELLSNDGNVIRRDIGVIVQQMLGEIGIEVEPRQMEWGAYLDRVNTPNKDFDATIAAWGLATDPDPSALWHSRESEAGLNNITYANDEVDELAELNKTILDRDERAEVIGNVYKILADEQPYTFLFYPEQHILLSNKLQGFTHHPRLNVYRPFEWYVNE